ncbi:MAG: four helix bundle protein [Bacteroidota bacterium]
MSANDLKIRVKALALRIITLVQALPKTMVGNVIGKQVLRSGTSIAANYYSACKARSRRDFINKLGVAEEEADETLLWLELLVESKLIEEKRMKNLLQEVGEVIAILASSRLTAKRNESRSS